MKVKSMMISDPITITKNASIEEAIQLMKDNSIRHLPVVSEQGELEGFVTLADLKLGLIPSLFGDVTLKDLIIEEPVTVNPEDSIETAAKLIYTHKISGMPVVKNKKLLGIITETDMLRTFIDMMGILTESSRIEVVIGEEPEAFKKVLQMIQDHGGDIINVGLSGQALSKRIYYFRLFPCQTEIIKQSLEDAGFEVSDAID
jgi:acetoin utilization protein AcuB